MPENRKAGSRKPRNPKPDVPEQENQDQKSADCGIMEQASNKPVINKDQISPSLNNLAGVMNSMAMAGGAPVTIAMGAITGSGVFLLQVPPVDYPAILARYCCVFLIAGAVMSIVHAMWASSRVYYKNLAK